MNFPPGSILKAKHEETFIAYKRYHSHGFVKQVNEGDRWFVLEENITEDYCHYLMLDSFGMRFWIIFPAALSLEPFENVSLLPI